MTQDTNKKIIIGISIGLSIAAAGTPIHIMISCYRYIYKKQIILKKIWIIIKINCDWYFEKNKKR